MERIKLFNEDNLEVMKRLPDESIDVICIDPPYLYLKNQKLERPFDEHKFFSECRRLLTQNGFIVMFGRGESFYRWNTILSELKFTFKEEIVWDKSNITSPLMNISRVHESISIFCKGNIQINKVKVNYLEMKSHNVESIIQDLKRFRSVFSNAKNMIAVLDFIENGFARKDFKDREVNKFNLHGKMKDGDRCVTAINSFENGLNEKTIIKQVRDHYSAIHPTQKPVRLLERLLALVIPESKPREKIVVADFFGGSMSCMEAVHNMGMKGIACEIDQEYFEKGKERINKLQPLQPELFR
jgi:site-specific DNA-methyltransferase (adenine-specific)